MLSLSVVIPVFNEKKTVESLVEAVRAVPLKKEIVIVDDGSEDGTREILRNKFLNRDGIQVLFHEVNKGKGCAVRTGIGASSGDAVIIQDADMEYDPMDFIRLLDAMSQNGVNVVYGSRFMTKKHSTPFWHRLVNYFLTFLTNFLFFAHLTDMETCYKLVRRKTLQELKLESKGFELEVEITAKLLKRREPLVEIPIAYKGRTYHEGKKIGWKDGLKAIQTLFRYRLTP